MIPKPKDSSAACAGTSPASVSRPLGEAVTEGLLAEIYESTETRRLGSKEVADDGFEHLDDASRARVKSALFASLPGAQSAEGVIEVLNKRSGEFTDEDAHFLEEASRLAGTALTNLDAIEGERQAQLSTLERLTALYDLGRTFTSTLELGELLPIVAGKIRDILGAGACNLWLADAGSQDLYLAQENRRRSHHRRRRARLAHRRLARGSRAASQSRSCWKTRPRKPDSPSA